MKNLNLVMLCAGFLLQGCHWNHPSYSADKNALKAVQLAHAKENAEKDRAATEQQLKIMREHAAQLNRTAAPPSSGASRKN